MSSHNHRAARAPAATERARCIDEADEIVVQDMEGLSEPWQEDGLKNGYRVGDLTPKEVIAAIKGCGDNNCNDTLRLGNSSVATACQILHGDRLPFNNASIPKYYGVCSIQDHRLQLLQQNRQRTKQWLAEWNRETIPNHQGCRFLSSNWGMSRTLRGRCKRCHVSVQWNTAATRLIAISKLPSDQLWKGVATRKLYPHKYIFEASGRCNLSSHGNHCLTESHLNLETWRHNARRRGHHRGTRYCACYRTCIGSRVELHPEGGRRDAHLEWDEDDESFTWFT